MAKLIAIVLLASCAGNTKSTDGPSAPRDGTPAVDARPGGPSDQAERFCAAVSLCYQGVAQCLAELPRFPSDFMTCAIAAGDCHGVYACADTLISEDAACAETCQGSTAVTCQGSQKIAIDCTQSFQGGPTCVVGNYGPTCGASACSSEQRACSGSKLQVCDTGEGVVKSFDCAQYGWSCTGSGLAARCTDGTSTVCKGTGRRCDGTVLVECENGYERRFDCAEVSAGMGCYAFGGSSFCGWDDECDPATARGQESCSGSVLSLCAGGRRDTLDCAAYGYTSCAVTPEQGGTCN